MPRRDLSIRKAGTRQGRPHYGVECNRCAPPYPLAIGHLTREAAEQLGREHLARAHGGATIPVELLPALLGMAPAARQAGGALARIRASAPKDTA